jgi:hypothetical protein
LINLEQSRQLRHEWEDSDDDDTDSDDDLEAEVKGKAHAHGENGFRLPKQLKESLGWVDPRRHDDAGDAPKDSEKLPRNVLGVGVGVLQQMGLVQTLIEVHER